MLILPHALDQRENGQGGESVVGANGRTVLAGREFHRIVGYIEKNPASAGLAGIAARSVAALRAKA
jgi:hypothetical protein